MLLKLAFYRKEIVSKASEMKSMTGDKEGRKVESARSGHLQFSVMTSDFQVGS